MRNVIVTNDGVFSGIVDVDDLCFGDPRYPVALTAAVMAVHGGPQHYVASWLRHGGHADDALFRLYVAVFVLDLMSEHGQTFKGNERPSASSERAVALELFLRALEQARMNWA